MRRKIITLTAILIGFLTTSSPVIAAETIPTPDKVYTGKVSYANGKAKPIYVRTSQTGRTVRIALGYANNMKNCGAAGGELHADFVPSLQWLPVRNRAFEGNGTGTVLIDSDSKGIEIGFSWEISGRFTSTNQAFGELLITAWTMRRDRRGRVERLFTCRPLRGRWVAPKIRDRDDVLGF